ncbi:MFS transporter [Marinomonas sp. PE14-40]|uniref:MFS transporter n=1 Tax=Marinomonas sp. PE14-40 TaxID=3060621 RepID=UPI003F6693DC
MNSDPSTPSQTNLHESTIISNETISNNTHSNITNSNKEALNQEINKEQVSTQWLTILVLWIAGVYAAMQFAKFSTSYDMLLLHYQASSTTISMALSSVGIMGLFFGTVAGVLSGKLGHKKVLLASLLLGSVLSFTQSLLPSIEYLLLTRILEGLSHLGVVVAAPTLMISLSEPRHQAITMGLWGTFFGVAFALMGWLGTQILAQGGLAQLYQFHSLLCLPIFIYLALSLTSEKSIKAQTHLSHKALLLGFFRDLMKLYQNMRTLLPGLVFLFHTSMFVALLTFVPRITDDENIKNQLFILLPLISIGGTFLAGILAQYFISPQKLGSLAYIGVAIFTGLTLFNIDSPSTFLIFASCLLAFSGLIAGSSFAMVPYLARTPNDQAQSNGAIAQLGNLGASMGPPAFAFILAQYSNQGMLMLILLLCVFGVGITLLANRYKPVN